MKACVRLRSMQMTYCAVFACLLLTVAAPAATFFKSVNIGEGLGWYDSTSGLDLSLNGVSASAKWIQRPDLTTNGVDVCGTYPNLLADDYLCTTAEAITNIVIWASWRGDKLPDAGPAGVGFVLSFHADIPAGPETHSMPGDPPFWTYTFPPFSYTAEIEVENIEEWWYDPNPNTPTNEFPGDYTCWRYTFQLSPQDAFVQFGTEQEPIVYWLDAQMIPGQTGVQWGWKSSYEHWNDDAVWAVGDEIEHSPWLELIYEQPHLKAGDSIDLAFELNGGPPEQEEFYDWGDAPDPLYSTLSANSGANHFIAGPWLGDVGDVPDGEPDGQPDVNAIGDNIVGNNDENGAMFVPMAVGGAYGVPIEVNGAPAGGGAVVEMWIDWNYNGSWFDVGEYYMGTYPNGLHNIPVTVPLTTVAGQTYVRLRISSAGVGTPKGSTQDGEVEDYLIEIVEKFPPALGLKWRQPPDCNYGLNLESWMGVDQAGNVFQSPVIADDWWCDGRPINAIRWWGSYVLYGDSAVVVPPIRPSGFRLRWYLDIPASADGTMHSRPGPLLKENHVTLAPYGTTLTSPDVVSETYVCSVPLGFLGLSQMPYPEENKFMYNVVLDDSWMEKNTLARDYYEEPCSSNVYWISIEAKYDAPPTAAMYPWGWETTPERFNWNDAAVAAFNMPAGTNTPWVAMNYIPPIWPWVGATEHPYMGAPVNMAFAMLSKVVGRRDVKWQQLPNMELGTDMPSWRYQDPLMPPPPGVTLALRADDFISNGRRITDIHWWGSYIGWQGDTDGDEFNPVFAPGSFADERPLGFDLSWHMNDPTAGQPGMLLTNIFIPMDRCNEMYYCTIEQDPRSGYLLEHEYQYYVDLINERYDTLPWLEEEGGHYWLNIQAVFTNTFIPGPAEPGGPPRPHEGWGWKIAEIEPVETLPSMVNTNFMFVSPWDISQLPWWHPSAYFPHDLAFELTTDQPDTNQLINIVSIARATNSLATVSVGSVGSGNAGVQVLQKSGVLKPSPVWVDIMTNAVPFPFPAVNPWWRMASPASNEFYRVIELNP